MIYFHCLGGLGNRIKPLASTFLLPEHEVVINWSPIYPSQAHGHRWFSPFIGDWNYYFKNEFATGEYLGYDYTNVVKPGENRLMTWQFLHREGEKPLIDCSYEPNQPMFDAFAKLIPVDDVLEKVDLWWKKHNPYLALHVRYHHEFCEHIPWTKYLNVIDMTEEKVLVVTDSEEFMKEAQKRKNVCFYPRKWSMTDSMLYKSNIIEILLLSRCEVAYMSNGSTFGECAYYFGGGRMKPILIT